MKIPDLQKIYQSNPGFPGQNLGLQQQQVNNAYIRCPKMYGQTISIASGSTNNVDINLPKNGRLLIGISSSLNYATGAVNPTIDLEVNNTKFIDTVNLRVIDVTTLQERLFYPLNLPVEGGDNIKVSINGSSGTNSLFLTFHYI